MPTTKGHQAAARFLLETTRGTTPSTGAFSLFGRTTSNVKFFKDRELQEQVDIGDDEVEGYFSAKSIYGVEVEYDLYDAVVRLKPFFDRDAEGLPLPYSLEIMPNVNATVKHFYRGTGWSAQRVRLSGKVGEAWKVAVTFAGGKWADPVTADPLGTNTREAKTAIATTTLKHFASGAITLDAAAWAILLGEFNVEFDHGTEGGWTTGSVDPVADGISAKKRRIKGTATFSLDDGAKTFFDKVDGDTAATIVVPGIGTSLTLTGVRFPRVDVTMEADKGLLFEAEPFTAVTAAIA